jgi:hypothetical protein
VEFYRGGSKSSPYLKSFRSAISSGTHPIILVALLLGFARASYFWIAAPLG